MLAPRLVECSEVDNWLKDANTHGRNAAEQVSDLTKMVGQMQALIRVMAGQLKVRLLNGCVLCS